MKIISKETNIGGKVLRLEIGRFAPQTNSAVIAQYGETMVLATVVASKKQVDLGYFPLSVEYVERLYAGGKIKGSRWVKREGRPSDEAILIGRLIDRSIRPLFPKQYSNEVQVTITVLSVDMENEPDILSLVATSAALAISDVPWGGPIGAVRVGIKDGVPFLNPTGTEEGSLGLDLVVSATKDRIVMIEGSGKEVPDDQVLESLKYGKSEAQKIINLIEEFQKEVGKTKFELKTKEIDAEVKNQAQKFVKKWLDDAFEKGKGKEAGVSGFEEAVEIFLADVPAEKKKDSQSAFEYHWKKIFREKLLAGQRIDGRAVDEIRPIEIEVGILPRTHGSAMFRRGLTQVLTVTTLGAPSLQQLIESATGEESKRYIHHYSMPPYSSGEVGRMGGLSRREIGHGALAERAIEPVIPSEDNFPYTIRVVSEVMSSNGSTSMASTCGSTLSLMDAGVPIIDPVAGIAMGLVTGEEYGEKGDYLVLTDIAGIEDYNGDMDFKITGTKNGITAIQLDVKIPGLTDKMIAEVLPRAKTGREFILEKMFKVIDAPRQKISQYAPKVAVLHIDPEKIGEVIGPGGRIIKKMIADTGCNIEVQDDGSVNISGSDEASVASAMSKITGLTTDAEVGKTYEGEVKRIQPFGAFVEILPGKDGLVHVSQMGVEFVDDPNKIVALGQKVQVKVMEIDDRGRINLTMLLNGEKKKEEFKPRSDFRPPTQGFRPSGTGQRSTGGFSSYSRYNSQSKFRK